MSKQDVRMVRVYLTEGQHLMRELVELLHDRERVRGVTVFRGIAGFGSSGALHTTSLVDLSLDLPLVLEFFDTPERVEQVLATLEEYVEPGHIVVWPAQATID